MYNQFGILKKITPSTIYVRCNVVRIDTKDPDLICEKCYWHHHGDRAKGKMLSCDCTRP